MNIPCWENTCLTFVYVEWIISIKENLLVKMIDHVDGIQNGFFIKVLGVLFIHKKGIEMFGNIILLYNKSNSWLIHNLVT